MYSHVGPVVTVRTREESSDAMGQMKDTDVGGQWVLTTLNIGS